MTVYETHDGVTLHKIRKFDTDCFVHVIDLTKVKIKIAHPFSDVPSRVTAFNAQLGFNGGGWKNDPPHEPNEFLIIDGRVISATAIDSRPWIHISRDNKITIRGGHPNFRTSENLWGFDRIIAQNKVYNKSIIDKSVAPRTVYGKDSSGRLVVLVCEGRLAGQKGLTFEECWAIMQEFDVVDCGNADGGYSSVAINTAFTPSVLNKSYLVLNRRTHHQILFIASGENTYPETPPEQEIVMKGTVIKNFANIKTMDGTPLSTGLSMQIGEYAFGEVSLAGTDLINFDHFYRKQPNGTFLRQELGELCKAGTANMKLENISETPDPDPDPDPEPTPESKFVAATLIREDGTSVEFDLVPKGP